jgi:hypothetical protein
MKIKTDFVTNSSSSSFIVAFDQKTTFTYLKEKIQFMEKAMQVWNDCRGQRIQKLTPENDELIERILSETMAGYYPGYRDHDNDERTFLREHGHYYDGNYWDYFKDNPDVRDHFNKERDRRRALGALKPAMNFIKNNVGKYIGFFSYGDEDGEFMGQMEHGDTFGRLKHLHISHH